jgi:hypothetical protein
MLQLMIIALAVLGMLSNAGPTPPPAISWVMWLLCASFMFMMGARFDAWLRRWEAKPHWRRVRRPRRRQHHHSGTSIPLLDK